MGYIILIAILLSFLYNIYALVMLSGYEETEKTLRNEIRRLRNGKKS